MPTAAPKPCALCGVLVPSGQRCEAHGPRRGSFADRHRGTRQQRGYGREWEQTRDRILQRDARLCQPSLRHGLFVLANHVDHIVQKSAGGTDDDSNLQAISARVHAVKTATENHGRRWDEAAYFAAQGRVPTRGVGQKSERPLARTALPDDLSRD